MLSNNQPLCFSWVAAETRHLVFSPGLGERIRFDESRSVLLRQLNADRSKLHGRLMVIERRTTVERKGIRNDFSID
jgi:hypothetical protein